ncbi:MAG TPA: acyl carrier protein [Telluria sp.]|nr:acyl carrier protein [Telluria sp.]
MYLEDVKTLLADVLSLSESTRRGLSEQTALLGNLPELDSMAVVNLITALEERFGIAIDDDEIGASTFATVGTLADFVRRKRE